MHTVAAHHLCGAQRCARCHVCHWRNAARRTRHHGAKTTQPQGDDVFVRRAGAVFRLCGVCPRCDGYALRCRRPCFACRTVPSASHLQCHTAAVFAHRAAARHVSSAGLFGAERGRGSGPGGVDCGGGVCVHASGSPRYALVGIPALGWRDAAGAGGHHLANEPRQRHFAPHADTSPRCGAHLFRHGAEWTSQWGVGRGSPIPEKSEMLRFHR